jgi:hypothetical protein
MTTSFKCPLRCWDIFALLKDAHKKEHLKW